MNFVYLILACTEYEASRYVVAFTDESAAETFCEVCNEYQKTQPEFPHTDDDVSDDDYTKIMDAHQVKMDSWTANHPAGADSYPFSTDEHKVVKIELRTSQ